MMWTKNVIIVLLIMSIISISFMTKTSRKHFSLDSLAPDFLFRLDRNEKYDLPPQKRDHEKFLSEHNRSPSTTQTAESQNHILSKTPKGHALPVVQQALLQSGDGIHSTLRGEFLEQSVIANLSGNRQRQQGETIGKNDGMRSNFGNGEEAVAYFAQHGQNSELKFVHLKKSESGTAFRPYDLVVVPPNELGSEYYTLSADGLVQVNAGLQPSVFIPLSEWMRHNTIFNLVTKISFFKNYLVRKTYSLWKDNIRYNLYCQQRKKLLTKLFLGKKSFCKPLLEVQNIMMEIGNVGLLDLQGQKVYETPHFIEHQQQKRAEASKHLEGFMENLQRLMQRVCKDVENLGQSGNAFDVLRGKDFPAIAKKNQSMVSIRLESAAQKEMVNRAEQEAGMIADFIRLVDYICVESLVSLAVESHATFLSELQNPRKVYKARPPPASSLPSTDTDTQTHTSTIWGEQSGLFQTSVLFAPDERTTFTPTASNIQEMIHNVTSAIIQTVSSVSRLLYTRDFNAYVSKLNLKSWPHIGTMIAQCRRFIRIKGEIDRRILNDFLEAEEYVKVFENIRHIYDHDIQWNLADYSSCHHTVISFQADLKLMSRWDYELDKMRVNSVCGIMQVESRRLKQMLIPKLAEKAEAIKNLLDSYAKNRCLAILREYKQALNTVSARPQYLKDYAGFVEEMQHIQVTSTYEGLACLG
jgi:dynein heavy chain